MEETKNKDEGSEETLEEHNQDQKKIEDLENEILRQKDMFVRMAAEYDNYRKRSERDRINAYSSALSDAIKTILPVVDSLSRAATVDVEDVESYKKGLFLVDQQLKDALDKLGVKSFGKVGDIFDPNIHNAISHVEDESLEKNSIVEVFQEGYKAKDRIIRHAVVKTAN